MKVYLLLFLKFLLRYFTENVVLTGNLKEVCKKAELPTSPQSEHPTPHSLSSLHSQSELPTPPQSELSTPPQSELPIPPQAGINLYLNL